MDYYEKVTQPVVLNENDQNKVYDLLKSKRCRGCGERLIDGCMPGCTDRD